MPQPRSCSALYSPPISHPFQNTTDLLVVIPDDGIDVEQESRFYDELCDVRILYHKRARSMPCPARLVSCRSAGLWWIALGYH